MLYTALWIWICFARPAFLPVNLVFTPVTCPGACERFPQQSGDNQAAILTLD